MPLGSDRAEADGNLSPPIAWIMKRVPLEVKEPEKKYKINIYGLVGYETIYNNIDLREW